MRDRLFKGSVSYCLWNSIALIYVLKLKNYITADGEKHFTGHIGNKD